jgi:hypothetical protein
MAISERRFLVILAVLTILMAGPRFAHTTPDSGYYLALARYFQTGTGRESLTAPYVYRLLVPWIASFGPASTMGINMAVISVLCTLGAYGFFYRLMRYLIADGAAIRIGMLLLVISFPTFNYASAVLTDAAGFLCLVMTVYLLLRRRLWLFTLAASVSVLTRESNLVLVLAFWIYLMLARRWVVYPRPRSWHYLLGLIPIGLYLLVRAGFADLRSYYWVPTLRMLIANLLRPVSWATFLLALAPPLGVILVGSWRAREEFLERLRQWDDHQRAVMAAVGLACLMLLGYSLLSAFMSGRFVWPLYIVLIPLAAQAVRATGWISRLPLQRLIQDSPGS